MSLNFYLGEVTAQSAAAKQMANEYMQFCGTLKDSVNAFMNAPLSGKTYDSAKLYFSTVYPTLASGFILACEALIEAHSKFPEEFQSQVDTCDVIEDQLKAEIAQGQALLQSMARTMDKEKEPNQRLEQRYMGVQSSIQKNEKKLQRLYEFNASSPGLFADFEAQLANLDSGLAEVEKGAAWNSGSGTFDLGRMNMAWTKPISTRWKKREEMRQAKLKDGSTGKTNTLADYGLTEADLVQVSDPPELVYQKYIKFAALGLNPHTGKPLTDKEKLQFQYAAHAGTMSDLIGLVGGAYAGQKASNSGFYKNLKRITPKYEDINLYKYNSFDNPGPLSKFRGQPQRNFYGGRYNFEELSKPKILYRGGDSSNPFGQWFTETPPKSIAEVRINTAVKPQWIDNNGVLTGKSTIDTVYAIEFPAGTKIYKGPVGNQGGIYQGGLNTEQIYINKPWELGDSVKIIDSKPLK